MKAVWFVTLHEEVRMWRSNTPIHQLDHSKNSSTSAWIHGNMCFGAPSLECPQPHGATVVYTASVRYSTSHVYAPHLLQPSTTYKMFLASASYTPRAVEKYAKLKRHGQTWVLWTLKQSFLWAFWKQRVCWMFPWKVRYLVCATVLQQLIRFNMMYSEHKQGC